MESLFLSVLNMGLVASYVIAAIMLVRLFLKKAPKIVSYALWAVAGFRLAFPLSFESIFSLIPFEAQPATNFISNYVNEPIEHIVPSPELAPLIEADSINNSMFSTPTKVSTHFWLQLAGELWLIGIATLLIYSVVSILLLNRRLSGAVLSKGNIYEAGNLKTPFVLGFIRPKIYIPTGLSAEEKSYIILHEQTHIRRFDHMVKPVAFLILCVHWFNPLVWIAFILMSADMEMSCDERVLKEMGGDIKKVYSTSLLYMATGRRLISGNPLAFGEGNINCRIKNVLNFKKPAAWIIAVSVMLVAALSIGFATNRTDVNSVEVWSPQREIEDQDEYFKALDTARQSVKTEDVIVGDLGSNEKIARAWMDEWFAMFKALPENNMARIADGVVDSLEIIKKSKEGLAKAFVFSVTFSIRPTYPIWHNAFWMAGNTGNSPGRDETWGQMYREVELRIGDDGRYHCISMGTGGVGNSSEYVSVETLDPLNIIDYLVFPDGGQWEQTFTGFTSDIDGWFVGSPGVALGMSENYVYLTHDGGRTWQETGNVNEEWPRVLTCATFADANTGYLCFRYDIENIGRVYQTTDGGKTWKKLEIPILTSIVGDGVGEVRSIEFDRNGNGKMKFYFRNKHNEESEGTVQTLVSADKGQTWLSAEFLQVKEVNEKVLEKVLDELVLENGDNVQLIYNGNGDVVISLSNERIVLRSDITETMLFSNKTMPNIEFKLHEINGDNYVGVTEYYPTIKTLECNERIFKIANNRLISFWSSNEIELKLLNVNKQEIEIGCSLSSEPIILRLTEDEGQLVVDKLASLEENNIKMDESFWKSIQENLLRDITGCNWVDVDKDGDDEMIISLFCHTVGAITPVHLRERGIMVFEVADSVELRKVIFERDNKEEKLKPYFINFTRYRECQSIMATMYIKPRFIRSKLCL